MKWIIVVLILAIVLIAGCATEGPEMNAHVITNQTTGTNQAEIIVQQSSNVINENLQLYGFQMDSNYLSRDLKNFWEVTVYDPYYGKKDIAPKTYCGVDAFVNKSNNQVEYLFFGLLCPDIENNKCKNLTCYSINDEDQNFNEYVRGNIPEISNQSCNFNTVCNGGPCVSYTNTTCENGFECIHFPGFHNESVKCAQPNPCSYFKCLPWEICTVTNNYGVNVSSVGCLYS